MPIKSVEFFTGYRMPIIGLGTWQGKGRETEVAVNAALEAGYRLIDTAYSYENEAVIGKVLKNWLDAETVTREELFIVSKLPMIAMDKSRVEDFLDRSLKKLQLEYLDLYLIHCPVGFVYREDESLFPIENGDIQLDKTTNHVEIWKALEEQVDKGKIRSLGLSNFNARQIQLLLHHAEIRPANLQVECNAYFQQKPLREFCRAHSITVCAYAPLGSSGRKAFYDSVKINRQNVTIPDLINDPVVKRIADTHGKTTAQILMRHLVQLEIVVIPKSTHQDRIKQNFDLSEEEMAKMDSLDKGAAGRTFRFSNTFKSFELHPEYPFADEY